VEDAAAAFTADGFDVVREVARAAVGAVDDVGLLRLFLADDVDLGQDGCCYRCAAAFRFDGAPVSAVA
jgi:hypothetical protein